MVNNKFMIRKKTFHIATINQHILAQIEVYKMDI